MMEFEGALRLASDATALHDAAPAIDTGQKAMHKLLTELTGCGIAMMLLTACTAPEYQLRNPEGRTVTCALEEPTGWIEVNLWTAANAVNGCVSRHQRAGYVVVDGEPLTRSLD